MPASISQRNIRAARGNTLSARTWMTEAPIRMLMNNLDAEVAENPAELVVYGGIGRAARDWNCYDRIVETLKTLTEEETLLVQSNMANPMRMRRACSLRIPISCRTGRPGNIFTSLIARDWPCSAR